MEGVATENGHCFPEINWSIVDYRYTDYRLPCQNENSILCLLLPSTSFFLSQRKISTDTASCAKSRSRPVAGCASAPARFTAPSSLYWKKNLSKSLTRAKTR